MKAGRLTSNPKPILINDLRIEQGRYLVRFEELLVVRKRYTQHPGILQMVAAIGSVVQLRTERDIQSPLRCFLRKQLVYAAHLWTVTTR